MSLSSRHPCIDQPPSGLVYVALGASDVVGEGADDPTTEAWPLVLSSKLGDGTIVHRLGVSSSTASQALSEQIPAAEALRPQLATVWLGVNDYRHNVSLDDYRGSLAEITSRLVDTGSHVFVANLPDLRTIPELAQGRDQQDLTVELEEWNSTIAEVAGACGAVLVDLLAASEGLSDQMDVLVSDDGFHPSTLGHIALAEIFFHHIEAALESLR